jgi:hypothetical protein
MWRFIVADDPQMIYESRCDNVASQVQCRMLQESQALDSQALNAERQL